MPEILNLITTTSDRFRTAPMPRHKVSRTLWEQAAGDASRGMLTLLSLWATKGAVHMALLNEKTNRTGIVSLENQRTGFPSVGKMHPPAQRLERAIADLHGLVPEKASDARPWLDHGKWPLTQPLGKPGAPGDFAPYAFLPVIGESLHKVPVGPVHAGIIEPGHFRFTAQGETVVRLEERLGYTHKGTDRLLQGATLARGAELAGRTSGDSAVAYAWAYSQAVEAALGVEVPDRAVWLRALMAELERLANHLGDIGAVCNDAAFAMMLARTSVLREDVLRVANTCFGHRYMRDCVVPGGVAVDLSAAGRLELDTALEQIERAFPPLVELYDNTGSLLDRTVNTGVLQADLAARFGAGGYVGRASGRAFDARKSLSYAPYGELDFLTPLRSEGDVNARIWIRIEEVRQSFSLIHQILRKLPDGPLIADLPRTTRATEGLGLVEGFRGDVLVWLRLDARGRIARCHMRDPSWFQWPLLEAVIENNIIADFPLCNKSFNCSYSGHDL